MRVSVALCTYNGARYLQDQLDSLARQTRLPDELVVCDDGSSDQTIPLLREFAAHAPFAMHIEQNAANLGSTKNFEKAIRLCSGDIIALCDQDDVWFPEKLAQFENALQSNPEAGLVFSDAELVDQDLRSLHKTMWQTLKLNSKRQRQLQTPAAFSALLGRNYVTGAAMAFRASYRDQMFPISAAWVHDRWIATNIAARAPLLLLPYPLIQYRQHDKNQIGAAPQKKNLLLRGWDALGIETDSYRRQAQAFRALQEHLDQQSSLGLTAQDWGHLNGKVDHTVRRAFFPASRWQRLRIILAELIKGRYHRYSVHGFWSALRDLIHLATIYDSAVEHDEEKL
jgi:glycosyltransferase involved in cell wall biosynthesis